MFRPFEERDTAAVDALLDSSWPDDPALREISAIHGEDHDDGRWRRTLVSVSSGEIVGAGTLLGSARHPTRYFVVLLVAAEFRRRGIGSALLAALTSLGDGRPLLARVRETDGTGVGFLRSRGFGLLMRSRVGVVDPHDPRVRAWAAGSRGAEMIDADLSPYELAVAHEEAYAAEHASWSPTTERPVDESLRIFCGDSWLPQTARAVRSQGRIAAVAGLHGPPLASVDDELFLIAGSATGDEMALRAVVGAELELARTLGARVSIEADEANPALSRILAELSSVLEPTLLLFGSDVPLPGI